MSDQDGAPWWASGAETLDETADPLDAHREARRNGAPTPQDAPAGRSAADEPWGDWGDEPAVPPRGRGGEQRRDPGRGPDRSAYDIPWEDWDDRDPPPPAGGQRSTMDDAMDGLQAMLRMFAARRGGSGGRGGLRPHAREESCRACPWCLTLRALGDARPEVVEHLDEAMRHLVAAARAWVDAAEHRGSWERIELDEDPT